MGLRKRASPFSIRQRVDCSPLRAPCGPPEAVGCRRVIVETSTVLPPRQDTEVPVRITRESRRAAPFEGITETLKVPNLERAFYPLGLRSNESESSILTLASKFSGREHSSAR